MGAVLGLELVLESCEGVGWVLSFCTKRKGKGKEVLRWATTPKATSAGDSVRQGAHGSGDAP